jgi:hypothetical protein
MRSERDGRLARSRSRAAITRSHFFSAPPGRSGTHPINRRPLTVELGRQAAVAVVEADDVTATLRKPLTEPTRPTDRLRREPVDHQRRRIVRRTDGLIFEHDAFGRGDLRHAEDFTSSADRASDDTREAPVSSEVQASDTSTSQRRLASAKVV